MGKKTAIRLQKYLAEAGVCSRRAGETLIKHGRVSVNHRVVSEIGVKVVPGADQVRVDGRVVAIASKRLFVFYKPFNVVSTMRDPAGRPCVADYLRNLAVRVFPVGRLDFDAAGLLLLTNDGLFAEQMLHPRYGIRRVYWALVDGQVDGDVLRALVHGVEIAGGPGKALCARRLMPTEGSRRVFGDKLRGRKILEVMVEEGRNHFVKNILSAVGLSTILLCRVAFGDYKLKQLAPGEIIEVSLPVKRLTRTRRTGKIPSS